MIRLFEFKIDVIGDISYVFVKAQTINEALSYCNGDLQEKDIPMRVTENDCIMNKVISEMPNGVFEFIG